MEWVGLTKQNKVELSLEGETELVLRDGTKIQLFLSQLPNYEKIVAGEAEDVVFLAGKTIRVGTEKNG